MKMKDFLKAARIMCAAALMMGAMFAASVAITACSKDDNKDEGGTFTPPSNATAADLKQLIADANAALRSARQISITFTDTEDGVSYKGVAEANADTKKYSEAYYEGNTVIEFEYVDGDKRYSYDKYDYEQGEYDQNTCSYPETKVEVNDKELRRPTTTSEKQFMYTGDYISVSSSSSNFSYKVDGSKIVVTRTNSSSSSYGDTTIYEVTLTADKHYKNVKHTSIYWSGCSSSSNRVREVSVSDRTFSYSANPAAPMSTSDFTDKTADYIACKVKWGADAGNKEDTFWARSSLYGENVAYYAPDVAGKVVDKFTVGSTEYSYYSYIPLNSDGSTVITAVWKTGSASSVAAPQAQPASVRRHGRLVME